MQFGLTKRLLELKKHLVVEVLVLLYQQIAAFNITRMFSVEEFIWESELLRGSNLETEFSLWINHFRVMLRKAHSPYELFEA